MTQADDKAREHNRKRSEAIQRFVARYDARTRLRSQADDWAEGFPAATDMTHTIGATSGDRVGEAATAEEPRAGHGLAERSAAQARWLDQWIREGDRSDNETFALLPADHPLAEMRARHANPRNTGAGICERCGHNAVGIRESSTYNIAADRLKNGYCYGPAGNGCYDTWLALNRPNRDAFNKTWSPNAGLEETADDDASLRERGKACDNGSDLRPASGE